MTTFTPPVEKTAIALDVKRDVNLTQPWFTQKSKYPPRAANFVEPLTNGEQAFGAVHAAVSGATKSIDIITWGFDPSMRLRRPDGLRYGELLLQKAKAGLQVRVLVWSGAFPGTEPTAGDGLFGSGGGAAGLGSGVGATSAGNASGDRDKENKYGILTSSGAMLKNDPEAMAFNRRWFAEKNGNMSFRRRGFDSSDSSHIWNREIAKHGRSTMTTALATTASHHQKMLLVDYELPDAAVGFVMGHNSMNDYWDSDSHDYDSALRLGFGPWQDLSSRVFGPVLFDLNENFSTAWTKAQPWFWGDMPIPESRKTLKPSAFEASAAKRGKPQMAQICRTQPQEGDQSILDVYKIALSNARSYVYFENQYFRNLELAMHLREVRRKLKAGGWKRDFYIFVVTNVPELTGRVSTYDMLNALGKSNHLPRIEKQEEGRKSESEDSRALRKRDLEGVNIHVCTLCASGFKQDLPQALPVGGASSTGFPNISIYQPPAVADYKNIYVHSKLLLVDDVFFTVGSANVNVRSMESDSELNIAVPAPDIAREWRQRLWEIHTKRKPGNDLKEEFRAWQTITARNGEAKANGSALSSALIEFYDDSPSGFFANRRPD
ncbi:phosphatidylserine/phosphatidylglycerophosphate/cardiolipin synthase family protein [Variovorax sp. dw_308]|uniref:phospholipase D-like domain-containing protein n=1 Tax=Variovorax sp. dw_308 TaxID=2721546 RepID=UPI001C47F61C|nr:phosphatidylserine/phosphatidylglycerophosphate/cardiolipin synthase family protein [Variovorax sp. dw_308]